MDRRCRHAVYGLVWLTLVNIAKHARLRWLEWTNGRSPADLMAEALRTIANAVHTVVSPD